MSITVKWGRERLHVALPPPQTKLGTLRESLADYVGVPPENIKLILGGGIMKDNDSPIFAFGIRDGTTLHMIGGHALPPSQKAPAPPKEVPQRPTERDLISKIQEELQRMRHSLSPPLEAFLSNLDSASPPSKSELEHEHVRLGELLLQSLLRLDALMPEGEWDEARRLRKDAVREVQNALDKLDGGWGEAKNRV